MLPEMVYYYMRIKGAPEWSKAESMANSFSAATLLQYTKRLLDTNLTPSGHDLMYHEQEQGLWTKGDDVEKWRQEQADRIALELQEALQAARASVTEREQVRQAEYPETPYLLWDYESTDVELLDHLSRLHAAGCLEPLGIQRGYPDELKRPLTH